MSDTAGSAGVDALLIGSGILAALGGTSPLWWQNVLTDWCLSQKGVAASSCNGAFADIIEGCQQCQTYGPSFLVPLLVGLVALLAFAAKLKDALSF